MFDPYTNYTRQQTPGEQNPRMLPNSHPKPKNTPPVPHTRAVELASVPPVRKGIKGKNENACLEVS